MDSETSKLETVLMLLKDADVAEFTGFGMSIRFASSKAGPEAVRVLPLPKVGVVGESPIEEHPGYGTLFRGNLPKFTAPTKE